MSNLKDIIAIAADGKSLSQKQSRAAFDIIMSGEATPSQIGGLLMALRVRGESVDEIAGAVSSMRAKMLGVDAPDGAIDIVGTGGDASGTYNVSTCSAIVAAACGAKVAKHGNRALSSKSGAADVLAALGVELDLDPAGISRCIDEAGLGFMFAPAHHAAMRHVGPTRVELGTRTIFNLLGPLSNPAGVTRQMIGVFSPQWVEPVANVLKTLGSEHVWVVHGDGLDEITVTGPTLVAELRDGAVSTFEITPKDAGVSGHPMEALKGGLAVENAVALRDVLAGTKSAYRDIVLMNTAAALIVAGVSDDLKQGVEKAAEAIDSGAAAQTLETLATVSQRAGGKD
ncbi:MAG: anthranilate phosphoribosyltransferase [Pseudomonadota bacterium]